MTLDYITEKKMSRSIDIPEVRDIRDILDVRDVSPEDKQRLEEKMKGFKEKLTRFKELDCLRNKISMTSRYSINNQTQKIINAQYSTKVNYFGSAGF